MRIPNKLSTSVIIGLATVAHWHLPGCNSASEPQAFVPASIDQAIDADSTLEYDIVITGVGFSGSAVEVQHNFDAKVLETVGNTAIAVPIDEPWYDTVCVDLTPYGPYPEREMPDSMWHDVDPGTTIPVVAYRVERHWEDSGPTKGVTDWRYDISWWSYYHHSGYQKEPLAVANQFYGN